MKKILIVMCTLQGGGAEKVLVDIIKNIDKSKYEVTLKTIYRGGVYVDDIKNICNYSNIIKFNFEAKGSISKSIIKLKNKMILFCLKNIPNLFYKLTINSKYDIEIAFLEGSSTKFISSSSNKISKKYAWVHTDLLNNDWIKNIYKSEDEKTKSYEVFDEIFCVSEDTKKAFNKKFPTLKKASVQYNPVNEKEIIQKANEEVDDFDFREDKFRIVTVGRVEDQKGYDRLLKIHKRLIQKGFKYELLILGQGSQLEGLNQFIKKNKLYDSVKLLGFKSNPYKYMKKCDLFVCSSRSEGFSTVVTEAAILELPIISTNCSGTKELLGESEFGLVVENNDEALYEGLKKILNNKNLYETYKKKIIIRGKEFKLENRMKEIEAILDR